ncbi:helix-turn-helix DNA binding domain protein [Bacillus phage vB_BcgM]|nr:helix-turn-helix DNA binding domain protein [Bacillus phage vB_BcgM]
MTKDKKTLNAGSVLVQLYKDKKLCTKVDNMLDEGKTYDYIIEFCKEQGLSISKASLTNYKKKREEAIETGVPLLQLLDKRSKDNVTYISDKRVETFNDQQKESYNPIGAIDKVEKVFNDIEFLDEVIQKGFKGLSSFDIVDIPLAMKAMEIKAKITNNALGGLSVSALKEMAIKVRCKESALTEVVMKYVPVEQHEQLFEDLAAAEQEFYENLDLTEMDKKTKEAMQAFGL